MKPIPCPWPMSGCCTLVGAGPGDPGLLTLKALKAIRAATLLLVDDLVSPRIVELAAASARVIPVGRRGGRARTSQEFIEKLMIMAARQGEMVVRLKGGDPFSFGHGGEEVEHLRAAGVRVEVVNGIAAGLAAATGLGVSLPHRGHAHGVIFITGHAGSDGAQNDWRQLAQTARMAGLTLVICMGAGAVAHIRAELLAGGLSAATPVALAQGASLPAQRQVLTSLGDMAAVLVRSALDSPCIFVVGDMVRHAVAGGAAWDELLSEADRRRAASPGARHLVHNTF